MLIQISSESRAAPEFLSAYIWLRKRKASHDYFLLAEFTFLNDFLCKLGNFRRSMCVYDFRSLLVGSSSSKTRHRLSCQSPVVEMGASHILETLFAAREITLLDAWQHT